MQGQNYKDEAAKAFERIKKLLAEEGWVEFEHKVPDVTAWKRTLPGVSVEIVKASGIVAGKNPKDLRDRVYSQPFEEKRKTDETFLVEEVLETVDDNAKVLYQAYSAPWPVSNRDLVFVRSKWEEDGKFYQIDISTKHASKPDPLGSNVRADLISCYLYEPHEQGLKATYMVLMNPMGSVPAFIVNANVGKVPARVDNFRKL